jgi:hypothetical protein
VRILILDIETTPNIAHVWGLWQQNVGLNQLVQATETLCFAAKWHGEKDVMFHSKRDGGDLMVDAAHQLMAEADAIVHYNGNQFDIPTLNREFIMGGWSPPAPSKQIDLLRTVKSKFRFQSNKLDFVAQELGIGKKAKTGGHELWVGCMAGDEKSWATMKKYNEQDVRLTEKLYERLLPWIDGHPNVAIYDYHGHVEVCTNCGSTNLQKRGFAYTPMRVFQQYRCQNCGKYLRGSKAHNGATIQGVAT